MYQGVMKNSLCSLRVSSLQHMPLVHFADLESTISLLFSSQFISADDQLRNQLLQEFPPLSNTPHGCSGPTACSTAIEATRASQQNKNRGLRTVGNSANC